MSVLVIDTECTTYAKGNPYSQRNKLCYIGVKDVGGVFLYPIEMSDSPYGEGLQYTQESINTADLLVMFNAKFDIAWLRRYGIDCSGTRIHDCQLAHFILTNQKSPYPSLNQVAEYYGLGQKIDVIKEEYWDKGIDTSDIPADLLEEYLKQDLELTHQVYLKQIEEIASLPLNRQRLISLHNQDLLVLQEIEWNGILYNSAESQRLADSTQEIVSEMDRELYSIHSIHGFNNSSKHHLSCLLYGGTFTLSEQQDTGTVFKTGEKAGQKKFTWVEVPYSFPRLVKPLRRTECAVNKEEPDEQLHRWAVGEDILNRLPAKGKAKKIIDIILKRGKIEKLRGTYYEGLPKLIKEMDWEEDTLHGQLNQCVAATGRLSSTKPNLQNMASEIEHLFYSRYEE